MLQNPWPKDITLFYRDHLVILKSIMSFQMAHVRVRIGVLIEYNLNPITLLNLCVKCINCKWGGPWNVHETR